MYAVQNDLNYFSLLKFHMLVALTDECLRRYT